MNLLISSEQTAEYLAKKFGVPDNLIRDADERTRIVEQAQQMQQQQMQMMQQQQMQQPQEGTDEQPTQQ